MLAEPMRLLVASDICLLRDGLRELLPGRGDYIVAATAETADETLACAERMRPDIVLLDITMRGAFDVARELHRWDDGPSVVAFALDATDAEVIRCAESGVVAFVPRGGGVDALVRTLDGVACGEADCSPRVSGLLLRHVAHLAAQRNDDDDAVAPLTERERQVLELLREGQSNKEIARRLGIRLSTVKNHVHNILDKLRVSRRGEAAARVRLRDTSVRG
jgi:DNA-binding NarL/FixJ family response regulator